MAFKCGWPTGERHLGGPLGKALAEKADELFASPPDISNLDG